MNFTIVSTPSPVLRFEKPKHVRGIYLTAWSAGGKKKRANTIALIDRTELNSVVIDVRDDGDRYWTTGIPLAPLTPGGPWIMDPGTHRAHIMINPPKP